MNFNLPEFPNSIFDNFYLTSPQTPDYNCIAWAYGDDTKWYWPDGLNYWPDEVPVAETIQSFILLFETIGYKICADGNIEIEFEKIAIYQNQFGKPTHAARQLNNGFWTSKLGREVDIIHSLNAMANGFYGNVSVFMKRPK